MVYQIGDQLLKEYSNYMIEKLENGREIYFTRVVADQFILFMTSDNTQNTADLLAKIMTALYGSKCRGIRKFIFGYGRASTKSNRAATALQRPLMRPTMPDGRSSSGSPSICIYDGALHTEASG